MRVLSLAVALFAAVTLALPPAPPKETTKENALERRKDVSVYEAAAMGATVVIPILGPAVFGWVLSGKKSKNCRQYKAVFYSCTENGEKPPPTFLRTRIEQAVSGKTPNPLNNGAHLGLAVNRCIGGDGADYNYENMVSKQTWGCGAGYTRYDHSLQIWRWRNKWEVCSSIDDYLKAYVGEKTNLRFWYSNPMNPQVTCNK